MTDIDKSVPVPDTKKRGAKMEQATETRGRDAAHETRAFETWDADDIHKVEATPWVRAASLAAPPPRPGFDQRWVRVANKEEADPTNSARKFREGWRPRLANTVPPKYQPPTISHGRFAGCIGVEGMLLCERPKQLTEKRNAHFRQRTEDITKGVEAELQSQSTSAMPITQERTSKLVREVKIQSDGEE